MSQLHVFFKQVRQAKKTFFFFFTKVGYRRNFKFNTRISAGSTAHLGSWASRETRYSEDSYWTLQKKERLSNIPNILRDFIIPKPNSKRVFLWSFWLWDPHHRTRFAHMAGLSTFSLKKDRKEKLNFIYLFAFVWTCRLLFAAVLPLSPRDRLARLGPSLLADPAAPETEGGLGVNDSAGSVLLLRLMYLLPTCGPGAPVTPGVPDAPCRAHGPSQNDSKSIFCQSTHQLLGY